MVHTHTRTGFAHVHVHTDTDTKAQLYLHTLGCRGLCLEARLISFVSEQTREGAVHQMLPPLLVCESCFPSKVSLLEAAKLPTGKQKQRPGWLQELQMCPQLLPALTCSLPIFRTMVKPMASLCHGFP